MLPRQNTYKIHQVRPMSSLDINKYCDTIVIKNYLKERLCSGIVTSCDCFYTCGYVFTLVVCPLHYLLQLA